MLAVFARARVHNKPGYFRQQSVNYPCIVQALLHDLCLLEKLEYNEKDLADTLDDLEMHKALDGKTVTALKEQKLQFTEDNFSDRRTSLQKLLGKNLPKAAVNLLMPQESLSNHYSGR